ncbi:hypothetical protein K490DRAFT_43394 [Saccharata proteae CBS 121410]|uniref:Enhancer of polycomb-like protein n=1 Tax=Saccharata proteae CBS 121410 TaxID=1314787 RepID=A0A9P4HS46_9PEZI|nr:hypothetical protein K490DRAFT_43394 [Saccharata proteae CBS 121410]
MTQRITAQRFRQRKLSTKANLPIYRENEVEALIDEEAQRHVPKVETGVEKAEETEHHLQAVMSAQQAGGRLAQLYIPTREAVASKLKYDELYPAKWVQPATYIRFSSTVEDCCGTPYCMTSEDEAFLKSMNASKPAPAQCSEDQFEEVMNFFEETAQQKQPFAAVDNPPVVPYDEMEQSFDDTISEVSRKFAKDIYDHWKQQRLRRGNRSLMPSLKFETNLETDEADPYVCFRRREVRQTRKTRGRDAQVTEKLKKLRQELEEARSLMSQVKQREEAKRELQTVDRTIFEKRMEVKEVKRNLKINGDDEDLINQKPIPKTKPRSDSNLIQRGVPGMAVSKPQLSRFDGRPIDNDLVTLEEQYAKRDEEVARAIETNKEKHREWNKNYRDVTWVPITPPTEEAPPPAFREATAQQLPTPPASVSDQSADHQNADIANAGHSGDKDLIRVASPPPEPFFERTGRPSFRRRNGRGGRMMIDRRNIKRTAFEAGFEEDSRVADRYKYDLDSDEEDNVIPVDFFANDTIKYRILMDRMSSRETAAAQLARRSMSIQQTQAGHQAGPLPQQQATTPQRNGPS